MKKIILLLSILFLITGCNTLPNKNLDYNKIIGGWHNLKKIDNGWYITVIIFYDSNRCSISGTTSTSAGVNTFANFECEYKIMGDNIIVNNEYNYTLDEENDTLYDYNNISYIKLSDDPCGLSMSICN